MPFYNFVSTETSVIIDNKAFARGQDGGGGVDSVSSSVACPVIHPDDDTYTLPLIR